MHSAPDVNRYQVLSGLLLIVRDAIFSAVGENNHSPLQNMMFSALKK
jgi:hypothetical protein